ncbi:MAG: TolC family protein [Candidatus Omnitrophica bacterium]|nr:TolC family protein [Candidatus Omnitrophota bacterium]
MSLNFKKIGMLTFLMFSLCNTLDSRGLWAMGSKPPEAVEETAPANLPPLTLEEAYQASLQRSEELAMKKADIDMTWANFLDATSQALGNVSFQMEDFRQEDLGGGSSESGATSSFNRPESRENKFVISQPLFQGFKSIGALTGASSLHQQREYTYTRAKQLLFLDVAYAFYKTLESEQALEITSDTLKLLSDRVKDLTQREKIGKSRKSEVVTARARINSLKADRARTKGELQREYRMLEFLTGHDLVGRRLIIDEPLPPTENSLSHYLEQSKNRPDVESARYALKTAKRNIVVAQSQMWPTVSLDHTQYERRDGFQSAIDWDLLLKINVPLFQGGEALGKIKAALVNKKKSDLTLSLAERESNMSTKSSYDSLNARFEEYDALEAAVKTAEENYTVQKEDYALSLVTNLDVLAALENLNQTRLDFNAVHFLLLNDYRKLQVASGDCCESV